MHVNSINSTTGRVTFLYTLTGAVEEINADYKQLIKLFIAVLHIVVQEEVLRLVIRNRKSTSLSLILILPRVKGMFERKKNLSIKSFFSVKMNTFTYHLP